MDKAKYKDLFVSESKERLDNLSTLTVALEKDPRNKEIVNEIFRHAHSIKGMAATMGYLNISKLSHKLESFFDKIRKDENKVDAFAVDVILRAHSTLESMLAQVIENDSDEKPLDEIVLEIESAIKGDIPESRNANNKAPLKIIPDKFVTDTFVTEGFVKVRTGHLDRLIDIISEFMALKWRLKRINTIAELPVLEEEIDVFEKIERDLNDKILAMRMMPLRVLTDKLPKLVRDMSRELEKSIELEIAGENIELDKNVIESIESPLIHIIRNCVDHGIESKEERDILGKINTGNVFFKAFRFQNKVVMEIGDDGRGIDEEKIVARAVEMKLVKEDDMNLMEPERKLLLICAPGLSTKDKVSEVSGRGVGMDVVKSSIESLGGTLSIFSEMGVGTTFRIELPLTTAIIKVFVVGVGSQHYGIPLAEIDQVVEFNQDEIIQEDGHKYCNVKGVIEERLKFFNLREVFSDDSFPKKNGVINGIIIKGSTDRKVVAVEELLGIEEVIVKPLSVVLKYITGISGATILPTGKPMFLLNTEELFC